jgi:recombinational DNA repair ATPase RecF
MKLESFQVFNYKNTDDSNKINIDPNVTCFVGKNEAGKTALLQALYRLNPVESAKYDEVRDFPRKRLREYQRNVKLATHTLRGGLSRSNLLFDG